MLDLNSTHLGMRHETEGADGRWGLGERRIIYFDSRPLSRAGLMGIVGVFLRVTLCLSVQMQEWIDQAKNRLLDIIVQVKEERADASLRVAFVG